MMHEMMKVFGIAFCLFISGVFFSVSLDFILNGDKYILKDKKKPFRIVINDDGKIEFLYK